MVLGITDTYKPTLRHYTDWIRKAVPDSEIVSLSYMRQNVDDLGRCDGLVLTGGGDIHPRFYGKENAMHLVHGVDEDRDNFEFSVIRRGIHEGLPILGICRGMQVFNVALGGTMIPDVQSAGYKNHKKGQDAHEDVRHAVRVERATDLFSIVSSGQGEVNTNHHQAVDKIAQGLRATAYSPDGLVEGLEWSNRHDKPFLQLVQWHPERMVDFENPFSERLLEAFVRKASVSRKVIA